MQPLREVYLSTKHSGDACLKDFRALSSPFKINGKSPIDSSEMDEAVIVETNPEATLAQ